MQKIILQKTHHKQNLRVYLLILTFLILMFPMQLIILKEKLTSEIQFMIWIIFILSFIFLLYINYLHKRECSWIDEKDILHSKHSHYLFPFYDKFNLKELSELELKITSLLESSCIFSVEDVKGIISKKINQAITQFTDITKLANTKWLNFEFQLNGKIFNVHLTVSRAILKHKKKSEELSLPLIDYNQFIIFFKSVYKKQLRIEWSYDEFFTAHY